MQPMQLADKDATHATDIHGGLDDGLGHMPRMGSKMQVKQGANGGGRTPLFFSFFFFFLFFSFSLEAPKGVRGVSC
jgi:hypothetical protein